MICSARVLKTQMSAPQMVLRRAMSLLEVVLSLAILAVSLAMLGQLLEAGRVAAVRSSFEAEAVIRAQSLLDELIATQLQSEPPVSDDTAWVYAVDIAATEWESLLQVNVTVQHLNGSGAIDAQVQLVRWVHTVVSEQEQP